METKRDIILERQQELGDVHLDSYDDDGDYIFINYSATVQAETLALVIQQAEQIIKEIEGAVELSLGSPFKEISDAENEADFAISILVPLLRKMGFSNVRYSHGKKEYGKDYSPQGKNVNKKGGQPSKFPRESALALARIIFTQIIQPYFQDVATSSQRTLDFANRFLPNNN